MYVLLTSVPVPSQCANATAPEPACLTTTIIQVVASSEPIILMFLSCGATAANSL